MEIAIYNISGQETGKKAVLKDEIFGIEPNNHAIYLDVKQYLANRRQGTHKSKQRNEVAGSTRKLKKQKGTGGARAGSILSPLFPGGGRVFGPVPRDYSFKLNKKLKQLARKSALTYKAKEDAVKVVEDFSMEAPKTKEFLAVTKNLSLEGQKILLASRDEPERGSVGPQPSEREGRARLEPEHLRRDERGQARVVGGLGQRNQPNVWTVAISAGISDSLKAARAGGAPEPDIKISITAMDILIKPILTEKMTAQGEKLNRYGFIVDPRANKLQIKSAVEAMYNVVVMDVNTINYMGKLKSRYTKHGLLVGRADNYKKAIVTLKDGDKIDFYSNI